MNAHTNTLRWFNHLEIPPLALSCGNGIFLALKLGWGGEDVLDVRAPSGARGNACDSSRVLGISRQNSIFMHPQMIVAMRLSF